MSAPFVQRQLSDYEHVKVCLQSTKDMLDLEKGQSKNWQDELNLQNQEVLNLSEENAKLKRQVIYSKVGVRINFTKYLDLGG